VLKPLRTPRRERGGIAFDERTGEVCDARCRAAVRRERDLARGLLARGPR
jgi:hypothetical protein